MIDSILPDEEERSSPQYQEYLAERFQDLGSEFGMNNVIDDVCTLSLSELRSVCGQYIEEGASRDIRRERRKAAGTLNALRSVDGDTEMAQIIIGVADSYFGDILMRSYSVYMGEVEQVSHDIMRMVHTASNTTLQFDDVYHHLLRKSHRHLRSFATCSAPDELHTAQVTMNNLVLLGHEVEKVREVISLAGRDQLAVLNLDMIDGIFVHGPVSAEAVRDEPKYASIRKTMRAIVEKRFPDGDDEVFEAALDNPHTSFCMSLCEDELLAYFSLTDIDDDTQYADWGFANPDAPVEHLAAATAITFLKHREHEMSVLHATKFSNRVCDIAVEHFGSVGYGITHTDREHPKNSQHKHTYGEFRKLKEGEEGAYVTKSLALDRLEELKDLCAEGNTLYETTMEGRQVQVCRTTFQRRDDKCDIDPADSDYFIYQAMEKLGADNQFVMTRVLRGNNMRERYFVFEESALSDEMFQELREKEHAFYLREHGRRHGGMPSTLQVWARGARRLVDACRQWRGFRPYTQTTSHAQP